MAKGAAGGLFFSTDDCQASYEELKGRGVEFSEEPSQRPYGDRRGLPRPVGQLDPPGPVHVLARDRGGRTVLRLEVDAGAEQLRRGRRPPWRSS